MSNKSYALNLLHKFPAFYSLFRGLRSAENQNLLTAKLLIEKNNTKNINRLDEAEFKVYSQFGDDGIIQYLINKVRINKQEERFIEIGTEDYTESNTRFLLLNNNWSGLIIEADKSAVNFIKRDDIYWKHDLTAVNSFVTKDNINELISDNGYSKNIGILSLDIDGNDYWIWKAINVVNPVILIAEYNGLFGYQKEVTIPYKKDFTRFTSHFSGVYWGCSIKALYNIAGEKGYEFVGTNSAGNNAYFVKKSRIGNLKKLTLKEGFTMPKYRESRDKSGKLSFVGGYDRLGLIRLMKLYNIETRKLEKIAKIYSI